MNYRYEISQLRQQVENQQQSILIKDTTIQKLEKQRENDSKYLLKLETMIAQKQKPEFPQPQTAGNITNSKAIENPTQSTKTDEELKSLDLNFNDKKEVKEFIQKSIREIQALKEFQSNVYEISKNYDAINENIIEGMNMIQQLINNVNQSQRLDQGQFQILISKTVLLTKTTLKKFQKTSKKRLKSNS
jgi:hypothetical protein